MYRNSLCVALALCGAVIIGGCNNAKSPSTVAKEVNSASQKANENTANAEERAGEKVTSAEGDVRHDQQNEQHVAAVQEEKVAKTDAEGQRNIALAKCEALSGDPQQACKDQANAGYDMAVAQAKQERAGSDPKR
jgi:uncharacterized lipoprotein NlpE involved in copper resistance